MKNHQKRSSQLNNELKVHVKFLVGFLRVEILNRKYWYNQTAMDTQTLALYNLSNTPTYLTLKIYLLTTSLNYIKNSFQGRIQIF